MSDDPTQSVDREQAIITTFVRLADTLVDNFDVIDFLRLLTERCIDLIDVDEAAIMLASPSGPLQAVASSSERSHLLELFEIQNKDGPCLDAYRLGVAVWSEDLNLELDRWPTFTPEAMAVGFRSVYSLPLRLRSDVIGALNLLRIEAGALTERDAELASAMSEIATVGLIQERTIRQAQSMQSGLESALTSRVRIEQAKGILSERSNITVDEAFVLLRNHARHERIGLSQVAADVVARTLDLTPPPAE